MEFGRLIARKRRDKEMSQTELAGKIKKEDGGTISPQYLNDIEHGRRSPSSDDILEQLAAVLEINPDYLKFLAGKFPTDITLMKFSQEEVIPLIEAFRNSSKLKRDDKE